MGAIITPKDMIEQFKVLNKFKDFKVPDYVVLTFESQYTFKLEKALNSVQKGPYGLKVGKVGEQTVALKQCKMGTTAATVDLEILQALGVKKFISIGSAGGLNSHNKGDLLVGKSAISDDGIELHYPIDDTKVISNSSKLFSDWNSFYKEVKTVTSWTTSAPMRETAEKFNAFTKEGASVVEMEMASLLAVANFRDVEIVNLFVISDILTLNKWILESLNADYATQIEKLVDMILKFIGR